MKRIFTFIGATLLMASAVQVQAQLALYPGLTEETALFEYKAPRATTPPVVDGDPTDAVWQLAPWKSAMRINTGGAATGGGSAWGTTPMVEPAGPFAGVTDCEFKYKFIWDDDRYYMLMYWKDDNVIYADNHNGYGKIPAPSYVTVTNSSPAAGSGIGIAYQSWNMDQLSLMFANYSAETLALTSGFRADRSLWYNFFPAKVTHSAKTEAVLWTQVNNWPTGVTTIQSTTSACKYNETEKAYYIEFADETWQNLFNTVKTKTAGQKDFSVNPVAVGDKFLFSGEVNDADGITNRRDYSLFVSAKTTNPNNNATESVVIELVQTVPQGLFNPKSNNSLEIYPNVTAGNTVSLSRATDVTFYNLSGHKVLQSKNETRINISSLKQGIYMVKDSEGNVNRLIRN